MNLHPFSSLVQPGETPIPTEPLPPNPAPPPAPPRPRRGRRLPMWLGLPRFPATGTLQSAYGLFSRLIPKIGITSFSGKSSMIIEGKYEKSLTKHLAEAGLAVREVIACDRRILGFGRFSASQAGNYESENVCGSETDLVWQLQELSIWPRSYSRFDENEMLTIRAEKRSEEVSGDGGQRWTERTYGTSRKEHFVTYERKGGCCQSGIQKWAAPNHFAEVRGR